MLFHLLKASDYIESKDSSIHANTTENDALLSFSIVLPPNPSQYQQFYGTKKTARGGVDSNCMENFLKVNNPNRSCTAGAGGGKMIICWKHSQGHGIRN